MPPVAPLPALGDLNLADLPNLLAAPNLLVPPSSLPPLPSLAPLGTTLPLLTTLAEKKLTEKEQQATGKTNEEFLQKSKAYAPAPTPETCAGNKKAIVIAVSLDPYNPDTIATNLAKQHRSLRMLEVFTGKPVSRFGAYSEESLNFEGFYAYKMNFESIENCEDAKDFTTKAVSYSRHIEKAIFQCHCENFAISKLRSKQ
uniref:Uncharacterized protein n=1 Tax=Panagrolaimus superbus TaxID=310955 RepID=A0A914YEA0_9BILA